MIQSLQVSTRKPFFWIVLTILSMGATYFAYKFFPYAFPIVDLNLTMNRYEALKKARELAQKNTWGPQGYKQAASFKADSKVNNFIELEGGGPQKLREIINERYFSPFFWVVRHFKEFDPVETFIYFTPEGKPYGFTQKIPDFMPGPALHADQARAVALEQATREWNIDFNDYNRVEESQKVLSSGRVEHTFVYELKDKKVGEAPYRLNLVVNGDQLTEFKVSLKVPEAFTRRYQEMRSSNNIIALSALVVMLLLYVFAGCLIGLFFLVKDHWLLWKQALLWGLVIASLEAANGINELPLLWLHYDTALSRWQFLSKILLSIMIQFFAMTALITFLFMIAEGLTRKAFADHIQFWKIWSREVASSWQVLGRTLLGYIIVGFDFAFSIGFYYVAFTYLKWWSPSEALYNPDTVATYVPWLTAVSSSLSAGFMEEMLFRAIPLSCAALLGNRYGNRTWWIAGAFILQAVVFGAAHANYPAQPAFARLVELIIPSFVFGGLYLRYGLLPAVISHYIFDVVWFSLPIFISNAPFIWVDKILVIIISLIPLLIVIGSRVLQGRWHNLSSQIYNNAWKQPQPKASLEIQEEYIPAITLSPWYVAGLILMALFGGFSWFFTSDFSYDSGALPLTRNHVIEFVKTRYPLFSGTVLSAVEDTLQSPVKNQHFFVWKQLGKEKYHDLLKSYLKGPSWKVRLVNFEGDIIERAQEYQLFVTGQEKEKPFFIRQHHKLPESMAGNALSYDQARKQALDTIQNSYNLLPQNLKEISGVPRQQPHRLDWTFTFQDTTQMVGDAQARVVVEIDGDEVVDHYTTLFVPEKWERDYKAEESFLQLIHIICLCIVALCSAVGAVVILRRRWNTLTYNKKIFGVISTILLAKYSVQAYNTLPLVLIHFSTSEPYYFQLFTILSITGVLILFKSGIYGLLAGVLNNLPLQSTRISNNFFVYGILGISAGFIGMGGYLALVKLIPQVVPQWPDFSSLSAYNAPLSIVLMTISNYIGITLFNLFALILIDYISKGWKKHKIVSVVIIILLSICLIDIRTVGSLWSALGVGFATGVLIVLLYCLMLRFSKATVPLFVASWISLDLFKNIIAVPYPGSLLGTLLAILFMVLFGTYWAYYLYRSDTRRLIAV